MPRRITAELVELGERPISRRRFRRQRRGSIRRPSPIALRASKAKKAIGRAFRGLEKRLLPRIASSGLLERAYEDAFRRLASKEKIAAAPLAELRDAYLQVKAGIGRGGQPLGPDLEAALARIFRFDPIDALAGLTETEIDEWVLNLEAILADEFVAAYNIGGTNARRFLGVRPSFNLRNPGILEALETRANLLSGGIGDDIFERIRTVVARDFYFEGLGPKEVARSLRDEFNWLSRSRSELIAHMETLTITEEAQQDLYEASGVELKRWITTLDGRERPSHFQAHGQIKRIDEPFELEDPDTGEKSELMHPGDDSFGAPAGEIMRCRCDMIPIVHQSQIESSADVWDGENDPDQFSKERIAARRGAAGISFDEDLEAVEKRLKEKTVGADLEDGSGISDEMGEWTGLLPWLGRDAVKAITRAALPGAAYYAKGLRHHAGRWWPACLLCGLTHRAGKGGCACPEPPGRPGPCVCEGGGVATLEAPAAAPAATAEEARRVATAAVNELHETAKRLDGDITGRITSFAAATGGTPAGLEFRVKTNLARAVEKFEEKLAEGFTPEQARADMHDMLRYTVTWQLGQYVAGRDSFIDQMESAGFSIYDNRQRNYWESQSGYKGDNYVFKHPSGFTIEVQFHTPASRDTKESIHKLYEKARLAETSAAERKRLEEQMLSAWDQVEVPAGVMSRGIRQKAMDTYYKAVAGEGSDPVLVFRVVRTQTELSVQRFAAGEWIEAPSLLRYFYGQDTGAFEIDAAEASRLTAGSGKRAGCRLCGRLHRHPRFKGGCACPEAPGRPGPCACEGEGGPTSTATEEAPAATEEATPPRERRTAVPREKLDRMREARQAAQSALDTILQDGFRNPALSPAENLDRAVSVLDAATTSAFRAEAKASDETRIPIRLGVEIDLEKMRADHQWLFWKDLNPEQRTTLDKWIVALTTNERKLAIQERIGELQPGLLRHMRERGYSVEVTDETRQFAVAGKTLTEAGHVNYRTATVRLEAGMMNFGSSIPLEERSQAYTVTDHELGHVGVEALVVRAAQAERDFWEQNPASPQYGLPRIDITPAEHRRHERMNKDLTSFADLSRSEPVTDYVSKWIADERGSRSDVWGVPTGYRDEEGKLLRQRSYIPRYANEQFAEMSEIIREEQFDKERFINRIRADGAKHPDRDTREGDKRRRELAKIFLRLHRELGFERSGPPNVEIT